MRRTQSMEYQVLEFAGPRLAVMPESVFLEVCRRAGVTARLSPVLGAAGASEVGVEDEANAPADAVRLARRLAERRRRAGLTQTALAQRAGVRPETLNRIERGRTTPDFATIRKLVVAMAAAEQDQARAALTGR